MTMEAKEEQVSGNVIVKYTLYTHSYRDNRLLLPTQKALLFRKLCRIMATSTLRTKWTIMKAVIARAHPKQD